jgi:hypothetical protein
MRSVVARCGRVASDGGAQVSDNSAAASALCGTVVNLCLFSVKGSKCRSFHGTEGKKCLVATSLVLQ